MRIILKQTFPLGRFHATPWKAFPFDDPHGEWPPSPWRLLRGLLARSHQWEREGGAVGDDERRALVRAVATSRLSWHLPPFTWRGPGLRQYQPAEWSWVPKSPKKPGRRGYNQTLVQDNFWLTNCQEPAHDGSSAAIWWVFEGERWSEALLVALDACLARMTYFGRAESITEICRVEGPLPSHAEVNCHLESTRRHDSVPVLASRPDATLEQLQASTDSDALASATFPPGACWLFAVRPRRPLCGERPAARPRHVPTSLIQFAVGARVPPPMKSTVILTNRFRGRVIRQFLRLASGGAVLSWKEATVELRELASDLTGKHADGEPVEGHRHAWFIIHYEQSEDASALVPARLIAWRREPFGEQERQAILTAAAQDLELSYRQDAWSVRLVPLDRGVPPPPGFAGDPHRSWQTATPYVPPRHVLDRRGRVRPSESAAEQLRGELTQRGLPGEKVKITVAAATPWVRVHQTQRDKATATNSEKRGYHVRLDFAEPIPGPIALGHSAHFGLGLFVPAGAAANDQ